LWGAPLAWHAAGVHPNKSEEAVFSMALSRHNVTRDTWEEAICRIEAMARTEYAGMEGEDPSGLFSSSGLPRIPTTNMEWSRMVGYEHEGRTLWFRIAVKKGASGSMFRARFGPISLRHLSRVITWNAAMAIHTSGLRLHPNAARLTAMHMLKEWSTCPVDLLDRASDAVESMCHGALMSVSTVQDRSINRMGMRLLEDSLGNSLGRRTCTNRALRRAVCMRLVARGIGGLGSRMEQRGMLRRELSQEGALKPSALRAIERMLSSDRALLAMNNGEPILIPYTGRERRELQEGMQADAAMQGNLERAARIQARMASGRALTGADRVFRCKHRELFP